MYDSLEDLVGKKIQRIFMNDQYLRFETDAGIFHYIVSGGCCSNSYFHDFIGVQKLLKNGKVISTRSIDLELSPEEKLDHDDYETIQCYGFELVTEDPEFGEVTSIMSFRNSSNGYYGGSLESATDSPSDLPEILADWLGD